MLDELQEGGALRLGHLRLHLEHVGLERLPLGHDGAELAALEHIARAFLLAQPE